MQSEPQVVPGLGLLAWAAQQVSRMIGNHQRNTAVVVLLAAQTADRCIRVEQLMRSNATDREYQPGRDMRNLGVEVFAALCGFLLGRIAIARRSAFENIGDKDRVTRLLDGSQHFVEQLARAPDEGFAATVFLGAGRFADYHPVCGGTANTEHGLRTSRVQRAARAGRYALPQSLEAWRWPRRFVLAALPGFRHLDLFRFVTRHEQVYTQGIKVGAAAIFALRNQVSRMR